MIIQGDCLTELKKLESESVNCCVTSPPYWALRDYGTASWEGGDEKCDHKAAKLKSRYDYDLSKARAGTQAGAYPGTDQAKWLDKCPACGAIKKDLQLGLEPTFQEYITKLCDIFDEVKRVLKKNGTCWVNLGDTYAGSGAGTQKNLPEERKSKEVYTLPYQSFKKRKTRKDSKQLDVHFRTRKRFCCECGREFVAFPHQYFCGAACSGVDNTPRTIKGIPENKCLLQIPSRFSIEMCNRGWILRNTIIWFKPNCMPSSVKDRFTVDFEYIFFFVKNKKYWFETQYEPHIALGKPRQIGAKGANIGQQQAREGHLVTGYPQGRNKRCVWKITTKPFKGAHFAVFPEELIETPIKAGCPKGGTVMDIFAGSGTTGVVAKKLGREFIGIELNPEYIKMAEKRIANTQGSLC